MPLNVKVDGVKKEGINNFVKVGGEWKQVAEVLTKVNGVWKRGWKGNFIDLNVFYSTTEPYYLVEERYDNLPNSVVFIGLEISVYGASNKLLFRETHGTDEDPNVISSASYGLFSDDENLGELAILVNRSAGQIEYSFFINSDTAKRIEVKIDKILKP